MARLARKKQEAVRQKQESEAGEENIPTRPQGELVLEPPPDREEAPNASNLLTSIVPMLGSVGMMAFMALSQTNNPRMLFMAGAMVFAMVSMVGMQMYRQVSTYRAKVADVRGEYLAYLADTRRVVRDTAKQHYQYLQYTLPDPDSLVLLAESGARVWGRRTQDAGFLNVRLGQSQQKLSKTLRAPEIGVLANPDVVCQSAVARFVDVQSNLGLAPFGVYLEQFLTVELCGPRRITEAQLRAMITHLAVMVPPADLRIAVLAGEDTIDLWDWVKWLPHSRSEDVEDAVGPARMVSTSAEELDELMGPSVETRGEYRKESAGRGPRPHILLVVDGAEYPSNWIPMSEKGMEGLTRVVIRTTWEDLETATTLRLILRMGKGEKIVDGRRSAVSMPLGQIVQQDTTPLMYRPDQMSIGEATAIARRLTRFTEGMTQAISAKSEKKASSDLMDLLGLGDVRLFDPDKRWRYRKGREYLRVPFGLTDSGSPIIIDIKESAKNGMGPHGMLIGATGSGKSEVLRTMVLAMALTHDPIQLNFVLVDFKGGATFAGMDTLPHVSAMISNLEEESFLVARMEEALQGEMSRRQELLRAAGNFAKVEEYENARRAGKHDGPPLPALFVIIDEFSELLVAHADFIKVFEAIGRLGRSLSVHLLFASQRIDTKAGDLMSHISYRIGLKTFSAGESRSIIGSDAAFKLPPLPGSGYLLAGGEEMVRFRASYVAAPPRNAVKVADEAASEDEQVRHILPFLADRVGSDEAVVIERTALPSFQQAGRERQSGSMAPPPPGAAPAPEAEAEAAPDFSQYADMSQLDIAVKRMEGHGLAAHKIWLEPLDTPPTLDMLFGDLDADPRLGLVSQTWRGKGPLRIPMGIVDLPRQQKQEPLEYDFSGAKGHGIVVGSPMTGKSTALRSLVMSLALTASPLEVQFYVLDFGGTFSSMRNLPHIAGIAARGDNERATRILAEIEAILTDREAYFRKNGIDTMSDYRRMHAAGEADDGYGDVFLILDGWATFKEEYDGEDRRVGRMMERALNFGVHLIVGAGRWLDLRMDIQPLFGTKIELRVDDESASIIDRQAKKNVPVDRPGRGLDMDAHQMLLTLPRIDGDRDPETLSEGVRKSIATINSAARGMHAPRLRLLPERVGVAELLAAIPELSRPMAELEAEYTRALAEEAAAARAAAPEGEEVEEAPLEKPPVPLHDKCLVLGVEERRLGPLVFDPLKDQHIFTIGDGESGRSSFIRLMAHEIMRTNTPKEAKLVVVDPRRSLLGEIPDEYLLAYLSLNDDIESELRAIASAITKKRAPGKDVTVAQLRDRSWWSGPEVWVLVDDAEMLTSGMSNMLQPLDSLLAQARDVGMHMVLARRTGSGVMSDRFVTKLRELGGTGLILSGNPDDGAVIGRVKAAPARPGRAQVVARNSGLFRAQIAWQPQSE